MAISGQSQSIVCHRQGNLLCSRLFWEYGTSGLNRKLYWRVIESVPRGELCGCWSETSLGTTGKHKHTLYRNTSWNFLSTIDEKMCFVYTTIARSWYIFGGIHSHRCQLVSLITLRNWHRNSRLRPHLIDSKGGLKVTLCHGRKKIKISRQSVWLFFFSVVYPKWSHNKSTATHLGNRTNQLIQSQSELKSELRRRIINYLFFVGNRVLNWNSLGLFISLCYLYCLPLCGVESCV